MDMWGNVLRVLKVCMGGMVLGKEMQKEEDCWISMMKKSCVWQTHGFIRQTNEKLLTVLVDVKQRLILCLREKIQEVCNECERDSMGTSAQAGDRRSG